MSRHVKLPHALERFVHESVDKGRYPTVGAVVQDALTLLQQKEKPAQQRLKAMRGGSKKRA